MKLPTHAPVAVDERLFAQLLECAHAAADAAAVQTLAGFRRPQSVANKLGDESGLFDPVTMSDQRAEAAIREVVTSRFPEHAFLGEESGARIFDDALLWVVDPIDGTRAYMTGSPLWGTLIAVHDGEQVLLGVLDQPFLGERLVGTRDRTTLIDRHGAQAPHTSAITELAGARLQTTAPELFDTDVLHAAFSRVSTQARLTRFGGDCYSYALLAMGHVDVIVECGLEPYDIQALIPIVQGAGGVLTDWSGGNAAAGGQVVASANRQLHEEVLALLGE